MWCFAVIEWGSCQINSIGSFVINNATQKKYREFFVGFNVFYCFIKEAERSLTFILYCIKIYTFSTNPMKSIFLFSLIGFLLLVHRKALGSNDTVQLRVLSWNIQMLPNSIALFSIIIMRLVIFRPNYITNLVNRHANTNNQSHIFCNPTSRIEHEGGAGSRSRCR